MTQKFIYQVRKVRNGLNTFLLWFFVALVFGLLAYLFYSRDWLRNIVIFGFVLGFVLIIIRNKVLNRAIDVFMRNESLDKLKKEPVTETEE